MPGLNAADAAPSSNFAAITPSDSTTFNNRIRGIYVGVTGDVVVKDENGTQVTFKSVPAGVVLPIRPSIVMAATTASQLVALY